MSSVALAFLAAIACVNSVIFEATGILGGLADLEIDIGASQTIVTFTVTGGVGDIGPGYGIGFGGTTMDGTYAVLIDITQSYTLGTREVITRTSSRGYDEISGADNWDITIDTVNAALILTRDNDVSGTCSSCYTFSPSQTSLSIIYAQGAGALSASSEFTNHSGKQKGGQTLAPPTQDPTTGSPTTAEPTQPTYQPTTAEPTTPTYQPTTAEPTTPTYQPTTAEPTTTAIPTASPTTGEPTTTAMPTATPTETDEEDEFETCVDSTEIVTGVSVKIGKRESDKTMEITITGEVDKYSGVGFGQQVMDGTYAIVVTGEGTSDVMERTLGDHNGGDELTGDQKSFDSAESNTIDGTTQTVVIRRPYSLDTTYDFTNLLTCELDSIDAIAAQGSSYTFETHASKSAGTLDRVCDCVVSPDSANNIYNVFHICLILAFAFYFVF